MVQLSAVEAARAVISGRVHLTPVHASTSIGEQLGLRLRLKADLFQKTGSFKVRGVLNKLAGLTDDERARGLVSLSAGNHAAALSWGAAQLGLSATIVMPQAAAASKVAATTAYGGTVVLTDRSLMEGVTELQEEHGYVLVHPFDDEAIMAGHGTLGLEILEQVPDVEAVVVPVGGGGLIGGVASAIKQRRPEVAVYGVEPEAADAMTRSLALGEPAHLDHPQTIADGLAAPFAGVQTLAAVQRFVDGVVTVSEDQIAQATLLLHERTKLYVEPSAAAPLAALQAGALDLPDGTTTVLVASGGNVDAGVLADLLRSR
ncbi:MAG TPA: threonine/serine dehydratase [Nitriliruptorales bacterium]